MNKYLLLRDNKQSGPYTVPEIIAKGIKPYDLVWLEGKSAAWRYPSEIEELKAFAPAVEEQPFDRFYKKPEPQLQESKPQPQPDKKSRFEPVVGEETIRVRPDTAPRKVYINFPGGPKQVPVYRETKKDLPLATPEATPFASDNNISLQPLKPLPSTHSDRKLLYAAIAACLMLIAITSLMVVNYRAQRNNIQRLNEMVQQMEKRQQDQTLAAKAALASRVLPSPASEEPVQPVADEPVSAAASEARVITKKPVVRLPVAPVTQAATPGKEQLLPEIPKVITPPPSAAASENLYKLVSVTSSKYKTGMLGGISNLRLELTNNSSRELQTVAVEVKYLSPEKKVVKIQTVYFENIAPGGRPSLDVPKSNRGVSVQYTIAGIKG